MTEITATHNGWALCHDGINILHIVPLKTGNVLMTGQPYVEQIDDAEDAKTRVRELALSMRFTQEEVDAMIEQNFPDEN